MFGNRESNTRLVKYPDGKLALFVGGARFDCRMSEVSGAYIMAPQEVPGKKVMLESLSVVKHTLNLVPEPGMATRTRRKRKQDEGPKK